MGRTSTRRHPAMRNGRKRVRESASQAAGHVVRYLRTEQIGGFILLAATAAALIVANSPAADWYYRLGATDATTGQGIVAFVILRAGSSDGDSLAVELRNHVAKEIGPIAKPRQILVVQELPKTRSGKIMRRLLRDVAEKRSLGDVTTLQDSSVMDLIAEKLPSASSED